jgi:hypothetical protein
VQKIKNKINKKIQHQTLEFRNNVHTYVIIFYFKCLAEDPDNLVDVLLCFVVCVDVIPCSEHCNLAGDTICGDVGTCGMLQLLDSGDMLVK